MLRRGADAAADGATESYAALAYALTMRSKDDTNVFYSKDNEAAEEASTKAMKLKREAEAAAGIPSASEASPAKALKLHALY